MRSLNLPKANDDAALAMSDPDELARWLAMLPFAQPQYCAQLLTEQVEQLLQCQLELSRRIQLRTHFLQTIEKILPALRQEQRHYLLVQPSRSWKCAETAQSLWWSLHRLDKLIVVERYASNWLLARYRSKISLLTDAMHSARTLAFHSASDYLPLPQGYWHDLYQLWQLACEETPEEERECRLQDGPAVLFRQIVLLGMTASNRFAQAEQEQLQAMIRKYAPLLALHPADDNQQAAFLFHPELDAPPRFVSGKRPALESHNFWWHADTNAILPLLHERIAVLTRMHFAQKSHDTADERLLTKNLLQQWKSPQTRRSTRYQKHEEMQLVSQIQACWFAANLDNWQPPSWDNTGDDSENTSTAPVPPPPPAHYSMVNLSSQGMQLRGMHSQHNIRCGELVMLRTGEQSWQPGLIRWINNIHHGTLLEFGVEFIAQRANSAMTIPVITFLQDRPQMALLLPAIDVLDQPSLLLLPGRQFEDLKEFRVYSSKGEQRLRLTRLFQQSSFYQLCEFRYESQPVAPHHPQ